MDKTCYPVSITSETTSIMFKILARSSGSPGATGTSLVQAWTQGFRTMAAHMQVASNFTEGDREFEQFMLELEK